MFNLDILGQIYLVSSIVGGAFIIFNILIGQLGHTGSSHHDIHHFGSDHNLPDHSGSAHSVHHAIGDHLSHSSDTHSFSTHTSSAEDTSSWLNNFLAGSIVEKLSRRLLQLFQGEDIAAPVGMFLISFLNPMRIAILLTFFGLIGLLIYRILPFLGYLSMIPAVLAALIIANLFSFSIRWLMDHIQSAEVHNQDDLIGTVAKVSIPILADKTGQIVYIADSVRCQCSAKSVIAASGIKNGTKVMIVGMQDHIALVEPVTDPQLLEDLDKAPH